MDAEQNIQYYHQNTAHTYMYANNYDILVGDYLNRLFLSDSIALEIGSGFGRYTALLSEKCKKVIAAEPNQFMYDELKKLAGLKKNIDVLKKDIDELLSDFSEKTDHIFLFHVIHHLKKEELASLSEFIKRKKVSVIILEPNHINPLFFIQILITKDMKFSEEKGMFTDNSKRLKKLISEGNFLFKRSYLGILPRGITNFLGKIFPFFKNSSLFSTKILNPFFSYSVLYISPK